MLNSRTASAGLVAIAATAGTLLTVSPASALSPRSAPSAPVPRQVAAVHTPAAPAVARGDGDGDGGWWWWSSAGRFHHRHHVCRDGFCGPGFRHRLHGGYGGFGTNIDRNVNVVTNEVDIGAASSTTGVVLTGGY